jgi:hypothetical protein
MLRWRDLSAVSSNDPPPSRPPTKAGPAQAAVE